MIWIFVVLCGLALASLPQTDFNYSFQKFVLTWPQTFCSTGRCRYGGNRLDGRSFVVHGLWPSSNDPNFIRQMTRGGGDRSCQSNVNFNLNALPANLQQKLSRIMPGLTKSPRDFWRYQFSKHGSCHVRLAKNAGSAAPQGQLMVNYFQEISNLYDSITSRFRLNKQTYNGKADLAQALGLNPRTFDATVRNGNLVQLQICLSPSKLGQGSRPRPVECPNTRDIRGPIHLPGFRGHSHMMCSYLKALF